MKKKFLLPGFLSKADNYLLCNKPEVWSARTHLVAWYSLLFVIVLTGLCYINYTDARLSSNVAFWVGFVAVIAILALVVWLIYLLRFNVFKRFGLTSAGLRLVTFLLFFTASGLITFYVFVPLIVETYRAEQQFSLPEIMSDINKINVDISRQEMLYMPKFWWRDTLHVVDKKPENSPQFYDQDDNVYRYSDTNAGFSNYSITKQDLNYYLLKDSMIEVNSSTYIDYSPPNLQFITANLYYNDTAIKGALSSLDVYRTAKQNTATSTDISASELQNLIHKYYRKENKKMDVDNGGYQGIERRVKKYNLETYRVGITNIINKLTRFKSLSFSIIIRCWFYISFIIALILFVFRHTTTKTFFLSLLTAVILFILSTLISAFIQMPGFTFYVWFIGYFILFTILIIRSFYSKTRSVINGIAINLWVILLPFVPLLIVSYYYAIQQSQDVVKKIITTDYAAVQQHLIISEFAGPVLFCIFIIIVIHRIYTQWYSLPEE